jgi:hypothetical protein
VSKEDAGNGLNVEFLESIADGSRKATVEKSTSADIGSPAPLWTNSYYTTMNVFILKT